MDLVEYVYYNPLNAHNACSPPSTNTSFSVLTILPDIMLVPQIAPSVPIALDMRREMRVLVEIVDLTVQAVLLGTVL